MLDNATPESQVAIDELFVELAEHTHHGRNILTEVKYPGSGCCNEEYGVLVDLFYRAPGTGTHIITNPQAYYNTPQC